MNDQQLFDARNAEYIGRMKHNRRIKRLSLRWMKAATAFEYSYHFTWLDRPIIQFPQDIIALQQIIWKVKPDAIIETGIARGGSLVFYASMLELIGGDGIVLGIDIDIRPHNRDAIVQHTLSRRIQMIEGSSVDPQVVEVVRQRVKGRKTVLVVLDSNHTCAHVSEELERYASLVTPGSYCIVFDTIIEQFPVRLLRGRPWRPGNSPLTAVEVFLRRHKEFAIDEQLEASLLISVAPRGFLKRLA